MKKIMAVTIFILGIVVIAVADFNFKVWKHLPAVRSYRAKSVSGSLNPVAGRYWRGERLRKVIVDANDTAELEALRATNEIVKEIDYGSFKLLILSQRAGEALDAVVAHEPVEPENQNVIALNDLIVDITKPQELPPELSDSLRQTNMTDALLWQSKPLGGLFLVQFVGPAKDEWLNDLQSSHAEILSYVGNDAYVVRADETSAEQLIQLLKHRDYLQFVGDYEPGFRLRQTLREKIRLTEQARSVLSGERVREAADEPVDVIIQVLDGEAAEGAIALLTNLSLEPITIDRTLNYHNVWLSIRASHLSIIAGMDSVFAIEEQPRIVTHDEMQAQIMARKSGQSLSPGYRSWLASKGFPASGNSPVVVNVVDDCPTLHTTPQHLDISNDRIAFELNPAGRAINQSGHGFINAHIVGGNGLTPGPGGYLSGLGIAPFVQVGVTAIFNNNDEVYSTQFGSWDTDAYNKAVRENRPVPRVSNNSWGTIINTYNTKYDSVAQKYDALAYELGKIPPADRTLTYVFAAGNFADADQDGIAEGSTLSSPGIAKNVITVGASESLRKDPNSYCETDKDADNLEDIAFFSGRGHSRSMAPPNCVNREVRKLLRIKPDLVAPGTRIMGGIPQGSTYLDGLFGCEKYYPNPGQPGLYTWVSGTSHAAPAVSGGAALLLHKYRQLSPAMVKAWLMNSATRLRGAGTQDRCTGRSDLTTNTQGMGRLDLDRAFDGTPRIYNDQKTILKQGQTYELTGAVAKSGLPLRVTMAWTDPPAAINADSHLVNDLDLEVVVGSKKYVGNLFNLDISIDATSRSMRDRENNVESVYLSLAAGTKFTIRVRAIDINGNGVQGSGSTKQQDFALLVYNAVAASGNGISVPLPLTKPSTVVNRTRGESLPVAYAMPAKAGRLAPTEKAQSSYFSIPTRFPVDWALSRFPFIRTVNVTFRSNNVKEDPYA